MKQRISGLSQRAKVLIVLGLVVAGLLIFGALRGDQGGSGVSTQQYQQWRSECEQRATQTLDTSLYRVGGNQWVDEVNRCLTAKAND